MDHNITKKLIINVYLIKYKSSSYHIDTCWWPLGPVKYSVWCIGGMVILSVSMMMSLVVWEQLQILQGPSFVVAWWWVSSTLLAAGLHGMSCGCLWLENLGCSFDALGTTSTFGCCFRHVDCCVGGYGWTDDLHRLHKEYIVNW